MTVFTDIASDALQRLGVYAPGETISAADINQAFITYNDMVDYLSNQNLACYANSEQSFMLVPGDNSYPIGPSGQIVAARPLEILTNPGAVRIVDGNGTVYPVRVVDQFEWNRISLGTIAGSSNVTSNFPDVLFYDPQMPNGIINLWPTPSSAYMIYFDSRLPLAEASALNSSIIMPPGYNLMLKCNLAEWLLDYFGAAVDPATQQRIMAAARKTLTEIKVKNTKVPIMTFDLKGRRPNIYTSEPN